jgi:transcriptional regulator with XRE-family HTH domain
MHFRYHDGNRLSNLVTVTGNDIAQPHAYAVSPMVTRIGPRKLPRRRRRIYLKEHRELAGLTQEQLAERMGTTKATISRIEGGQRDYTGGFLEAAAEALGKASGGVFLYPPSHQTDIVDKVASAPENVREQLSTVIDAFLAAGGRRK